MTNFRLNRVKKNDVTLSQKFCNFTRQKFYDRENLCAEFHPNFLISAS